MRLEPGILKSKGHSFARWIVVVHNPFKCGMVIVICKLLRKVNSLVVLRIDGRNVDSEWMNRNQINAG